jgi:hypothetical protein
MVKKLMITKTLYVILFQCFHLLGLFKDNHLKELNFPTLFYWHPWDLTISKNLSYEQIAQWELRHKSKYFSTNISNLFFKATKVSIPKVKL